MLAGAALHFVAMEVVENFLRDLASFSSKQEQGEMNQEAVAALPSVAGHQHSRNLHSR
jgi:hypothetical protein